MGKRVEIAESLQVRQVYEVPTVVPEVAVGPHGLRNRLPHTSRRFKAVVTFALVSALAIGVNNESIHAATEKVYVGPGVTASEPVNSLPPTTNVLSSELAVTTTTLLAQPQPLERAVPSTDRQVSLTPAAVKKPTIASVPASTPTNQTPEPGPPTSANGPILQAPTAPPSTPASHSNILTAPTIPPSETTTTVSQNGWIDLGIFTVTCYDDTGPTKSGVEAGPGSIAVDEGLIKIGSKLNVGDYGVGIADDTGADIKGRRLDVWMSSDQACKDWGVRQEDVLIHS